jgi:hypothetical protein
VDPEPNPRGLKAYGSGFGYGSATLVQAGKNDLKKEKNKEIFWLDVQYGLFGGPEASSVAWKSFFEGLRIIIFQFFLSQKCEFFIRRNFCLLFGHQNSGSGSSFRSGFTKAWNRIQ